MNRPYINKKVTVILPCKNRDLSLYQVLPAWFCQIKHAQIVIVDYSSRSSLYSLVKEICNRHKKTLAYDMPHSDADCLILTVKDKQFFNMSHAINYAITRTTSDVISIAGCESLPTPYYLEITCNLIDHSTFTRCIRGRLTFPRHLIEQINGYPELMEYWGGEDDIVAYQFTQLGAMCIDLDYLLARNMQTSDFHNPLQGYANEELNLNRQYSEQNDNIKYRKNDIAKKFEGVKKNRKAFAQYCKDFGDEKTNNYGKAYGDELSVLLTPQSQKMVVDVLPEIACPPVASRCVGSRCAVIIPCMNRLENLKATLPMWLSQLHQNKQIVIIDYNSKVPILPHVKDICEGFKMSLVYNEYDVDADVVVFRLDGQEHFNISHAYNYVVKRIKTEVLSFACADTCPVDYYLDLVTHAVDEKSIIQTWWGLHTITYENWKKLNGHQEFLVGWGGEDSDFMERAVLMGLSFVHIPKNYCFHIPQTPDAKGQYREVKQIDRSNAINIARFNQYQALRGYVGNYKDKIGGNEPLPYFGTEEILYVLHVFEYHGEVDTSKLPQLAKRGKEGIFYLVVDAVVSLSLFSKEKWQQWLDAGKVKDHISKMIPDNSDITVDKFLSNIYIEIENKHKNQIPQDTEELHEAKRHNPLHNNDV